MPLAYDNATAPWYSEAERTVDGLQDWTAHGADTLLLYVQGQVDNAPEMLYVAIEDSTGKVVAVTRSDAATLVTTAEWQPWAIPLAEISAAGVQLDRVRTLYIGIGDRYAPAAGGTGLIYIDDIQFGRPATTQ